MGMFDNFLSLLKINKEKMTVLVVGLNNSGKSSIIQHFKRRNEPNSYIAIPTVGFAHEEFYSNDYTNVGILLMPPKVNNYYYV